jgi:zinc protease
MTKAVGPALLGLLLLAFAVPAQAIEIQKVVSPGGITAWLVEDHSNPLISTVIGFHGGSAADAKGHEGSAFMVSALLDEGAGELDSAAFQQRIADLAVDFSCNTDLDNFTIQLRMLSASRAAGFDLLRLALTKPRFDAAAVERIRGQLLARLASQVDDPDNIASLAWWHNAFPEHPYGRPVEGDAASIAAITAADLRRFVTEHFGRNNLVIGVVGDIDAATLGPLLDQTLGDLPAVVTPPTIAEAVPAGAGQTLVIDHDVPQTVVIFGAPGVKRNDPDFYGAALVDYILGGGGFASRLTQEVREKRGLTYGIDVALDPLDHAGLMQGDFGTRNARVGESIAVLRDVWKRLREDGPTARELAEAKTYLIGNYPLNLTSNGRVASLLVALQLNNLGVDYLQRRAAYINGVTLEDARRVAGRLLDPALISMVVVGRPEGMEATLVTPKAGG